MILQLVTIDGRTVKTNKTMRNKYFCKREVCILQKNCAYFQSWSLMQRPNELPMLKFYGSLFSSFFCLSCVRQLHTIQNDDGSLDNLKFKLF